MSRFYPGMSWFSRRAEKISHFSSFPSLHSVELQMEGWIQLN